MEEMPPQVDAAMLASALADGSPLLDVREPDEYDTAHVAGARLIPLMTVPDNVDAIRSFAADGPLYVICAAGGRSNRAAAFLRSHGIDASNVIGGTNGWMSEGRPVDTGGSGAATS